MSETPPPILDALRAIGLWLVVGMLFLLSILEIFQ